MMPAFVVASVALILVPGPNAIYILTRSASQGLRTGIASAFGVEVGTLVHIALAVLGVSALIAAAPVALVGLKVVGGAYLVVLGYRAWRGARSKQSESEISAASPLRAFWEGALVNLSNVKVGLFFLAFLPQFIVPERDPRGQMLVLGAVFFALALGLDLVYAVAGGAARRYLSGSWTSYAAAVVYWAMAAYTIGSALLSLFG